MAIVGSNGSGKSMLLKAMAKMISPLEGTIHLSKKALIEYVPQFIPDELKSRTVIESLLEHIATRRPSVDEWKAYKVLTEFGLDGETVERKLSELSGGEANRALLARAIVVEPDFIMLDEPTNHLDIEATIKFEKMIHDELKVPFCIVSHDRQLLDSCTTQTLFIRDKRLYFFGMLYSEATEALHAHDESQQQQRADQEKEILRLKAAADKMQN